MSKNPLSMPELYVMILLTGIFMYDPFIASSQNTTLMKSKQSLIDKISNKNDTTIDGLQYTVLKRFPNGQVHKICQFQTDCLGNKNRKHGYQITYNGTGKELKSEVYFYDQRRNRKFLGLKLGWWGFYLFNYKYFLGIKTKTIIVDPCF
jgi:hypothetical protein